MTDVQNKGGGYFLSEKKLKWELLAKAIKPILL